MATYTLADNPIDYLKKILRRKGQFVTRAIFWKIPHNTRTEEDIQLKIGRYISPDGFAEEPEIKDPKSELTLDDEEFKNLLLFISENYEPFKQGVKKFIPLDGKFEKDDIDHLRALFSIPDKQSLLSFITSNQILSDDLMNSLQHQKKTNAVKRFEEMLTEELVENEWQKWFKENDWVLCSEFVKVLEERDIDTENIADYLMQAYDGFLDIIEIKRPSKDNDFWAKSEDHNNPIPSTALIKAITQASKYIHEVEKQSDSLSFLKRVSGTRTIKPRCIVIFGRSNDWTDKQKETFRILNSSYHNLTILTYDHVLHRAKRVLGITDNPID